jgi:hypothetical protein
MRVRNRYRMHTTAKEFPSPKSHGFACYDKAPRQVTMNIQIGEWLPDQPGTASLHGTSTC